MTTCEKCVCGVCAVDNCEKGIEMCEICFRYGYVPIRVCPTSKDFITLDELDEELLDRIWLGIDDEKDDRT